MPLAFFSSLMGPWTSTFLGLYFSVRARALASLVTAILNISVNFLLGVFLDSERFHLKTRARASFVVLSLLGLCTWIWAIVIQVDFSGRSKIPKLDWVDDGFARAVSLGLSLAQLSVAPFTDSHPALPSRRRSGSSTCSGPARRPCFRTTSTSASAA